jgi:hypothetical protein
VARLAILLCEGTPGKQHIQLARILDFFGVPWETVEASKLADVEGDARDQVVFGLAETLSAVLIKTERPNHSAASHAAYYVYTGDDREASERGLRSLSGNADLSLLRPPAGDLALRVSRELPDVAGSMTGLEFSSRLREEDGVLAGVAGAESGVSTVISAGAAPVFVRFQHGRAPVFVCASSYMVDIDDAVGPGYYDVKDHFCSAVPLLMFVRLMFPEVAWRPQELGACLIIDDPLLRQRYGSCNFEMLRDLMRRYGFTTNIAFIPWNWRRTSANDGEFFKNELGHFSVSIHGCDHTGAEFGETSPAILNNKARLAQSRMRNHEARTGLHHDPVMVFPQGVFSSACPEVLKVNGFLGAVNTEIDPVDPQGVGTRIRDVWDVAIMRYGSFPIFTRRYAHHGLENFAFDLLLGKPCLIVAHHDFFKDNCSGLIELIEKLGSLNCRLRWRPLGEVLRRACRRRVKGPGEEVEMYANELVIHNPSGRMVNVHVRKRENEPELVAEVWSDQKPITWTTKADHLVYEERIGPRSERHLQVVYREQDVREKVNRSLRFELSVAGRRILSEFRDDYLSRSRFLSSTAASVKNVLTKVN